jgi:hypothetical protein
MVRISIDACNGCSIGICSACSSVGPLESKVTKHLLCPSTPATCRENCARRKKPVNEGTMILGLLCEQFYKSAFLHLRQFER